MPVTRPVARRRAAAPPLLPAPAPVRGRPPSPVPVPALRAALAPALGAALALSLAALPAPARAGWLDDLLDRIGLRDPAPAPLPEPAEVAGLPATPYSVELVPTGDDALDTALRGASQLVQLRETAPTGALGIVGRATGDLERFEGALRSEGYYGGRVRIEVAGRALDDPGLVAALERAAAAAPPRTAAGDAGGPPPEPAPVPVRAVATPGPRYLVGRVDVRAADAAGAAAARAALRDPVGVAEGDPARAGPVLDAEGRLLDRLRRDGHPLAAAAGREVVVDHDTRRMEITYALAPGPRARFAEPAVTGTERVDPDLVRRVAGARLAGQDYSPDRLERARRAVTQLGAFDAVRARPGERLDAAGDLPVTFAVTERKRRALGVTVAYETGFGPTGRVYWEHRNLRGRAERLRLEAEAATADTGANTRSDGLNLRAGPTLTIPLAFGTEWRLVAAATALRERLYAYDRDAVVASALFERPLDDAWTVQAGPTVEAGRTGRDRDLRPVRLAGLTLGLRHDGTDSPLDATRGVRAAATAQPFASFGEGASFTRLRLNASTYWDVFGDRGSVLAVRGAVGAIVGAERDAVAFDKRFYAGGGGSVRGYAYQRIGPRDAANRPLGGASLAEAAVELRQRLWGDVGGAVFVDAGAVGPDAAPTFDGLSLGVGAGLRYRTPIGPIRADVALPLNRQPGDSGYGLYVGLGQAF